MSAPEADPDVAVSRACTGWSPPGGGGGGEVSRAVGLRNFGNPFKLQPPGQYEPGLFYIPADAPSALWFSFPAAAGERRGETGSFLWTTLHSHQRWFSSARQVGLGCWHNATSTITHLEPPYLRQEK